jgi:threonine dehydratase
MASSHLLLLLSTTSTTTTPTINMRLLRNNNNVSLLGYSLVGRGRRTILNNWNNTNRTLSTSNHENHHKNHNNNHSHQIKLEHATSSSSTTQRLARIVKDPNPGPVLTWAKDWPPVLTPELGRPREEGYFLQGMLKAQSRIYDVCKETDLQFAPRLSALTGNRVYLKREDQQPVFSFKIRGAYNKIASLSPEKLERGIVTCSAGNHAQGVAYSASKLNINNVIVMPKGTPLIKIDAVRSFGGNVVLHGDNFDQAQTEAKRLAQEEGRAMIHPFDDMDVICGQSTIGIEISKQLPRNEILHAAFCCVGGGGLLSGVAAYLKRMLPQAKMIGVEACDAAGMTRSLEVGKIVSLTTVGLFADGAAVKTPGTHTFGVIRECADAMVTVTTDEICAAIKAGFNDTRVVFEPAGALAIAGLVRFVKTTGIKNKTLVAVTSGANMDFDRLRFVSERADSSEAIAAARIPERPGSFWELYMAIFPRNITEFSYRMIADFPTAHVLVGFQPKSGEDLKDVETTVSSKPGFSLEALTHDELVKTHLRYMAGGRAPGIRGERVFRFEFPERPGALKQFLEGLFSRRDQDGRPFNVTLFHYRAHGADVGRVFTGFQIEPGKEREFETYLINLIESAIGFTCVEETDNKYYREFLC